MTTHKNLPRDVFLYLLSIISLVASAISLGILAFQYVNVYLPDIISDPYFSKAQYFSQIRGSLAALIVFFPVYIWVTRFLKKDIKANPDKRDLKVRKWLLYLTLFIASLTIIGDLVALILNFLEGELTLRFILKVLTILFIAGSVFFYYFNELREDNRASSKKIKAFEWIMVIVVMAAVVAGFFIAGSPQNQRLIKLDQRRVNDLQNIQYQVVNYWQSKESLPQNLSQLKNDLTGSFVPVDPKTSQPYKYEVLGNLKFNLCANFDTSSTGDKSGIKPAYRVPAYPDSIENPNWAHSAGEVCFERTIDPQLTKPFK